MNRIIRESQSEPSQIKECLLRSNNSVSKKESASFGDRDLAWEASTLPLSYTRQNRIYFSPKVNLVKIEGFLHQKGIIFRAY